MKIAADYLQTLTILFRAGGGVLQTILHTPFVIFMRALVLDARQADLRADDQRLLLDQTRLFVDGSDAHSVRIVVEAAGRRRYDTERSEATRVGDDGHVGAVTERLLLAAAHAPRTVLAHAPRVGCTKSPLSIVFSSRCLGVELESFSAN